MRGAYLLYILGAKHLDICLCHEATSHCFLMCFDVDGLRHVPCILSKSFSTWTTDRRIAMTRTHHAPAPAASLRRPTPALIELRDDARGQVVDLYRETTADYAAWSRRHNMHFGYGSLTRTGLLDREAMLEAMNDEVLDRLKLPDTPEALALDLGCGLGRTLRRGAERTRRARWAGFTLSPDQAALAARLCADHLGAERLTIRCADYTALPLAAASAQAAYCVESACHAPGLDKASLVAEAARVLAPGGRLVVADAFRVDHGRPLRWPLSRAYRAMCDRWALPDLLEVHALRRSLESHGFTDVVVEDASLPVALCVLHVPFVALAYLWRSWRAGDRLVGWRSGHVTASLLTIVLGLCLWRFRYLSCPPPALPTVDTPLPPGLLCPIVVPRHRRQEVER